MASLNTRRKPQLPPQGGIAPQVFEPSNTLRTHEGAPAAYISPEMALRRSVCSCLLWEDGFYESGQDIGARIAALAGQVAPRVLADLAIDARSHFNLRHVPLLLCAVLARTGAGTRLVGDTIAEVIQRADELSEFLAVYAKVNGVEPKALKKKLSAQAKRGLALAFNKFDAHQLAKYDRAGPVRLRDALFLCHARPESDEKAELWRQLVAGTLPSPDTWEVALSTGADKRETFERQLRENNLGYLALLRNLRNMTEAQVDADLIQRALIARRGARRVLPFRYVAAARACPQMAPAIDQALSEAIAEMPTLPGKTVILVDVSGSMDAKLSSKSDLTRMDAAATLASVLHGDLRVFTFSNGLAEVAPHRGLAGIEAVIRSQPHQGTNLGAAIAALNGGTADFSLRASCGLPQVEMDRLIVITDEQATDHVPAPTARRAYMVNVASYQNGVGYGEQWTHIDGFSEQVIRFIHEFEGLPML